MTTQHTSGPWILNEHRSNDTLMAITAADEASNIGLVYRNPSSAIAQANARLIAAAPELLEALQYYVGQHEAHAADMPEWNENDGKVWKRTLDIAREAISKAKGQ